MHHSSITSRRAFAIVALAANLVFLGGCSNASVAPTAQNAAAGRRLASDGYTWLDVYYPGTSDNQVTGIANSQEVIGNYSADGGNTWTSYVATSGYTSQSYTPVKFPAAKSTYMYSINNDAADTRVGYVYGPGGEPPTTWATVEYKGLWSLLRKMGSGCPSKVHELLGYDDSTNKTAVGFYETGSSCIEQPFEVTPGDQTTKIPIPKGWNGNVAATGIDSNDDIVGTTANTGSSKLSAGWLRTNTSSVLVPMQCCGGSATYATVFSGITIRGSRGYVIVGYYTDSLGKVHGLLYTQNTAGNHWTFPIDEGNASGKSYTVINGINAAGDICGWYKKSASESGTYGFVGIPTTALRKRR